MPGYPGLPGGAGLDRHGVSVDIPFLAALPIAWFALCLIWLIPTLGLLVTSFRPFQDVNTTGWWTVLSPPTGAAEYANSCAACHGQDGRALPAQDGGRTDLEGLEIELPVVVSVPDHHKRFRNREIDFCNDAFSREVSLQTFLLPFCRQTCP